VYEYRSGRGPKWMYTLNFCYVKINVRKKPQLKNTNGAMHDNNVKY